MSAKKNKAKANKGSSLYKGRLRRVKGSNGILQRMLDVPLKRGSVTEMRKDFASLARASDKTVELGRNQMYTYSTAARKSVPPRATWENLPDSHLTLEGHEKGSLTRTLLGIHALGFRLFPKAAARAQFLVEKQLAPFECNISKAIADLEIEIPGFSAGSLFTAVTTGIRGKGENCHSEPLATRFFSIFCGHPMSAKEKESGSPELTFCRTLANALDHSFSTWRDLNSNPLDALKSIESLLPASAVQSLRSAFNILIDESTKKGDLQKATIAYDKNAPTFPVEWPIATLMIALCARYAKEAVNLEKTSISNYVKECITTINANGLGWLFNRGRHLLPNAGCDELKHFVGVDDIKSDVYVSAMELISSINVPAIFNADVLAEYRTSIQGSIDSFTSNHLARLQSSLASLVMLKDSSEEFLNSVNDAVAIVKDVPSYIKPEEILVQYSKTLAAGETAARYLLGQNTGTGITGDEVSNAIVTYTRCLNLCAYVESFAKSVNGILKYSQQDKTLIVIPEAFKHLIRLPNVGPTLGDVVGNRREAKEEYEFVCLEYDSIVRKLEHTYKLGFHRSIENRIAHYDSLCEKSGRENPLMQANSVAYRDLLGRITRTAFRGSDMLRRVTFDCLFSSGIIPNNKIRKVEWREHINNQHHFVFVNPLDTRPKKLLAIEKSDIDLVDLVEQIDAHPSLTKKDHVLMQQTRLALLTVGLPKTIATETIATEIVRLKGDPRYLSLLDFPEIARDPAIMLLTTAYRSKISGLTYRLNKKVFVNTRSMSPYTGSRLVYVPKDIGWRVPTQMFEGVFSGILASGALIWQKEGVLDSVKSVQSLATETDLPKQLVLAFLREIPHRFCIQADVVGWGINTFGLVINNGVFERSGMIRGLVGIVIDRDNIPLNRIVHSVFDGGKISPPMIQFEQSYFVDDNDEAQEDISKRRVLFKLPATVSTSAFANHVWSPDALVGIDPGQYGFGVALLNHLTGEKIDSGFIHINSLIESNKKQERHQKVTTPRQQYKSVYSTHLTKAADAAVGDICHIIDRLSIQNNAIPVFEAIDSEKGPHTAVWKRVTALYCYGDNDSQNMERKSHWFGASHWDTGYKRLVPNTKTAKPLILFPGARVSSYGNSYECFECGRNAVESLKEFLINNKEATVKDSVLVLNNGNVSLSCLDANSVRELKGKFKHPEWVPMGNRTFTKLGKSSTSGKELMRIFRRSIRRPHEDRRAKMGVESQFLCPYLDCACHINADANAALNVAKKMQNQLVIPNEMK